MRRLVLTAATTVAGVVLPIGAVQAAPPAANSSVAAVARATGQQIGADRCVGVSLTSVSPAQRRPLYVANELNYSGDLKNVLRARAEKSGPWESLRFCGDAPDAGGWFVSAVTGKVVSARLNQGGGYAGVLRATATKPGPWELFKADCDPASCSFQSLANRKYVAAEWGYTGSTSGILRARSDNATVWEYFGVVPH